MLVLKVNHVLIDLGPFSAWCFHAFSLFSVSFLFFPDTDPQRDFIFKLFSPIVVFGR